MKYRTIVADPPWEYEAFPFLDQIHGSRRVAMPYRGMSVEEICALPVKTLAAGHKDGAAPFLWTTNKYLRAAFDVIAAWGFSYRQTITWHKTDAQPLGSVAPNSELLLVARFGNMRWHGKRWPSSVIAAKKTEHSAKPDVFQDLIEQISPGPYLELFARRQRLGWATWGNEALEHVQL